MGISLPPEIITSDKTPRVAIAFDRTSGVKQTADTGRRVLLTGQKLTAGTQLINVPLDIFRETGGEVPFGRGSALDVAIKAAFVAHPLVKLTAVAVDDAVASVAATGTVTFAVNALYTGAYSLRIGGIEVVATVTTGDTPTLIAASLAAAINANKDLPVTAAAALGVVTITARNKGTLGNGIVLLGGFSRTDIGTTATIVAMAGGTGIAVLTNALAAVAGERYHIKPALVDDSASGMVLRDNLDLQGNAENGKGEIGLQTVNGTLSTATTLALAINGARNVVPAINGSETWFVAINAAVGSIMSSNEVATRPYNRTVVRGVKAPPVEKRWTRTEQRALLDNGVTPLIVLPGERVAIQRAVSTFVTNVAGDKDYSALDITIIQAFDDLRDNFTLMFNTNYPNSRWAAEDPDGLLPEDVATPAKVRVDLINVARDAERRGIVSRVSELEDQFVVVKNGTHAEFSVPADIVDGLHEILGKVVLIRQAVA